MYMAKSRSHQTDQFSLKKFSGRLNSVGVFFLAHTHAHETHSFKPLIPAASAHRNCTFPCKLRRVSFQQITSIHLCLNPVKRYTFYCASLTRRQAALIFSLAVIYYFAEGDYTMAESKLRTLSIDFAVQILNLVKALKN